MLPRYKNTNIPHVSISVALLNLMNNTNVKTNEFHPARDDLAVDSIQLIEQAKTVFPADLIETSLNALSSPLVQDYTASLSVNAKAKVVQSMLYSLIEDHYLLNKEFTIDNLIYIEIHSDGTWSYLKSSTPDSHALPDYMTDKDIDTYVQRTLEK